MEKPADQRPLELRVATFNIRNGLAWDGLDSWPFRRRATADAVARLDCDVVGLQEAYGFQSRYLLRQLARCAAIGEGGGGDLIRGRVFGGGTCTILHRPRLLPLWERTRWFSDTPDVRGSRSWGNAMPRIVTYACFRDARSGRRFGVANVHLEGWPAAVRAKSVLALLGWLDRAQPWIVLGDFNAGLDDPTLRPLSVAGFRDALAEVGVAKSATQLDHILVGDGWEVGGAAVGRFAPYRRRPSDHFPVTATLRLA